MPDPWTVIDHSLAQHKLTNLRDRSTDANRFQRIMHQIGLLLCSEMTRDLELRDQSITTENAGAAIGKRLDQAQMVILPILRSGLPLQEAFKELIPGAAVGHVGIYRDKKNKHHCYMLSLPKIDNAIYFVLDPIITQGLTQSMAVDYLITAGINPSNIRLGCVAASRQGLEKIYSLERRSRIKIFTFCDEDMIDSDKLRLVPGLGNVGSRLFGTEG